MNVTTKLQDVVSKATEVVDQSASNLEVVTTVITQISNISSPGAPVSNDVCTHPKITIQKGDVKSISFLDNYQCSRCTEQYTNMAPNSCGKKWFNVIQIINMSIINNHFSRIVKSFEAITSSLVQQENFTSLVTSTNQTTLVAQRVIRL